MTTVLIVEDDADVVGLVRQHLLGEGFKVASAANGTDALATFAEQEPDVVLLDIVLGDEDGRELLRDIRLMSDVPVIFLTGRGLESERIAGLKLGADDYIVKPFSLGELTARLESVLRRTGLSPAQHQIDVPTMRFGELLINEHTHEVTLREALVDLTAKEFSLLAFLASSPRQVFSREQILQHVWGSSGEWQAEATVTEHVRRVRNKIEDDPDRPRWIVTIRGLGYRFEPVERS